MGKWKEFEEESHAEPQCPQKNTAVSGERRGLNTEADEGTEIGVREL
jgi:hypothetical protein